ncbi:MAG: hypothetical protein ACRD24_15840 [Terriglobales bacterium]
MVGLQNTLRACGLDYEQEIKAFGQVAASEARASGRVYGLRDHVCGLLFSQLSNQRPWKPIAQNEERIRQIFFDYDPDALQQADPQRLEMEVVAIRCGNRAIRKQMQLLATNIETLRRIEREWGSVDKFVTGGDPGRIAEQLSEPGPYKLRQVGYALALEYLRNVGIRAAKPDVHVRRVLGPQRLSYFDHHPTEEEASQSLSNLADEVGCNATYLDNLLWLFCATGYGDVCGAKPRCNVCELRHSCSYPKSVNAR